MIPRSFFPHLFCSSNNKKKKGKIEEIYFLGTRTSERKGGRIELESSVSDGEKVFVLKKIKEAPCCDEWVNEVDVARAISHNFALKLGFFSLEAGKSQKINQIQKF